MKTIFQVPIDRDLKNSAEKVASEQGFSSLQEVVRVFLTKLALNKIDITLQESITLSPENEKRYIDMTEDFNSGKNINLAKDVDDLLSKLNEN